MYRPDRGTKNKDYTELIKKRQNIYHFNNAVDSDKTYNTHTHARTATNN